MGYYSDVLIVIDKDTFDSKCKELEESNPEVYLSVKDFLTYPPCQIYTDDVDYCFYWISIKWYAVTSEVVSWFESIIMDNLQKSMFIRVGEDLEDTEIFGDNYISSFSPYLERQIKFTSNKKIQAKDIFKNIADDDLG